MPPRIIALCGRLRSGKDTVADVLHREFQYKHVKISDPIKRSCKILFDLSDEQIEGHLKDEVDVRWGVTPRRILQFIGTDCIQELMPHVKRDFWVNRVDTRKPVVISDLRFLHEYDALKRRDQDVRFIRVERPGLLSSDKDTHVSETEYGRIPVDAILVNNGTRNDLQNKIRQILVRW